MSGLLASLATEDTQPSSGVTAFDFTKAEVPPPLIPSLALSSRGICYLAAERIWDGREGAGPTPLPAMLPREAIALSPPLFAETRGCSKGGGVGRGVDDSSFDPRRACCQKLPGLKRLLATIDCDN